MPSVYRSISQSPVKGLQRQSVCGCYALLELHEQLELLYYQWT